jgi:hypothetical protein
MGVENNFPLMAQVGATRYNEKYNRNALKDQNADITSNYGNQESS